MNPQCFVLLQNHRECRLASLFAVGIVLLGILPAVAEFKPRDRKPAGGYSRASGSRGCSSNDNIPLTLLAPQTFVGKTASKRPTLAWYASSSQPVRFRLFEIESAKNIKQIGNVKEITTTAGINKLTLPVDYPELTVGKTYFWQIAIDCENTPVVSRAEFTVINPPLIAKKGFANIPESANYYAENDLWYEALEASLKVANNGKLGQIGSTLVQDLAQSELVAGDDVTVKIIKQRVERLQKISIGDR